MKFDINKKLISNTLYIDFNQVMIPLPNDV